MDSTVPNQAGAIAVLCHPHPNYGGDRFNIVIEALYQALPPAGIGVVRFDFARPVPDGDLTPAVADIDAALAAARELVPGAPVVLVGYSYGAAAALAALPGAGEVAAVVLIAPPLAMAPSVPPTPPTLVLTPAHDQFSPPAEVEPVVVAWPDATFEVIDLADHFLAGRADAVAQTTATWLGSRVLAPGP